MVKECYKCKKLDFLNPNVSFHKPPKELERRDKWMKLLGLNKSIPKLADICSDHFEEKDFILNKRGNRSLKRDALPKEEINKDPCIQDNSLQTSVSEPLMKSEVMKTELYAQPDQGFKDFKTIMTKSELKKEEENDRKEDIKRIQENRLEFPIFINQNNIVKTEPADQDLKIDANDFVDYVIKNEEVLLKEEPDTNDRRAISADLREEGYDKTGQKEVGTKYGNNQGSKFSKQKFSCPECLYQTFQKIRLTRHMHRHKNIEVDLFKCSECTYQALQKNELDRHMLVHQDPNQLTEYKCDHCDYKTIRRSNLSGHMSRHKKPGRVKMLKCKECNYQAFDNSSIKRHIQKLHMATYRGEIFKCTNCDYKTIMIGDFNKHILIHEDHQCDQCDFKAKQKSHLIVHMRRHNTPRSCNECDFQASDNRSVKRHIRRFHMASYKGEIFKCSKCDYKTILKEDLKKHLCAYL